MIKNKISLYIVVLVLVLSGCKTKQKIQENISVDSVSSFISNEISDESYTVEISYPNTKAPEDEGNNAGQTSNMNDPPHYTPKKGNSLFPSSLPILPGTNIRITSNKSQAQTSQRLGSNHKESNQNTIVQTNNKNERQIVIFIVVLIIFICLSVRYSKKVRKKFGG